MRDEYQQEFTDLFQEDSLLNTARLGIEAKRFVDSGIGRYIIGRAERQIEEAYKKLSVADPDNPGDIRSLQFEIAVARAVPSWLVSVMQDGIVAERQIDEEDNT